MKLKKTVIMKALLIIWFLAALLAGVLSFCRYELSMKFWQEVLVDVFYWVSMMTASASSTLFCGMYFLQYVNWLILIAIIVTVGLVWLFDRIASVIYENFRF